MGQPGQAWGNECGCRDGPCLRVSLPPGLLQGSFARVSGSRHKTNSDSVTRLHLEELIFAFSYKFMVNESVEVDYYKMRCPNGFRILIPRNFSRMSGEYLEQITEQYTFA